MDKQNMVITVIYKRTGKSYRGYNTPDNATEKDLANYVWELLAEDDKYLCIGNCMYYADHINDNLEPEPWANPVIDLDNPESFYCPEWGNSNYELRPSGNMTFASIAVINSTPAKRSHKTLVFDCSSSSVKEYPGGEEKSDHYLSEPFDEIDDIDDIERLIHDLVACDALRSGDTVVWRSANGSSRHIELTRKCTPQICMAVEKKTHKERIELHDTVVDAAIKMAGGNPGALEVVFMLLGLHANSFVPHDLLLLDGWGIYEHRIWELYKDVCGENILDMSNLLKYTQRGHSSPDMLFGPHDFNAIASKLAEEEQ